MVLVLAVIGLGACVSQPGVSNTALPEDWPTRWLKGIPCRPPCWEGITPGQTTAEEAVEILRRSPIIATVEITIPRLTPERGVVTWNWASTGRRGGQAIFHAQTSSNFIYTVEPYLPVSFRLGDVIQAYGKPSHVIARSYYGPDIGSGVFYDLSILYRSQGFVIFDDGGRTKPILSADTRLEGPVFFAPNDEGVQAVFPWVIHFPKWVVSWQGMKDFDFYCRDEAGKPCP